MIDSYSLADPDAVASPALLFYPQLVRRNLDRAVEVAGSPGRLRPHVKTHKTREIVRLWLERGVTRHKCATLAEAEMLASEGVPDVLIAYPMVGPNCRRLARLAAKYPRTCFAVTADDPAAVEALSAALATERQSVDVLLDVDVGQHRTGITPGPAAVKLYESIARLPGLAPGGFHVYDGHNRQENPAERAEAVKQLLGPVLEMRSTLEQRGIPVPRLVLGGTPTFPIHARLELPGVECSPGTMVLHDFGYGTRFPDVSGFTPAAVVLTRVVSKPTGSRLTFDVGTKAVASDPPAGQRCQLLNVPDAVGVGHNEEHLIVESPAADRFAPGDVAYAVPAHVCPTVALYRSALTVEDGRVTGEWVIAARDRAVST